MKVTLTGPNYYVLKSELDSLVNTFVKEAGELALERLDGGEATHERLAEAIQSLPFLASKKMVLLTSPSAQKTFAEDIEKLLGSVPNTTDLVIVEPKLDKRSVYYKTLKSQTDFREFNELDARQLSNWLVQNAREQGGQISASDAMYLVERIGLNQQLLGKELEKLLIFSPDVTRESVDLLTDRTPQSTIFELLDSAFSGKTARMLDLYNEQRSQKVEPQQILSLLAWQLHVLALVKTAGERTPEQISKEAGVNPFVVRKTIAIAKKLPYKKAKKIIHDASELDLKMKTKNIDADDALQHYLISISEQITS